MIDRITPVILTYNEAPNIARTLEKLTWARDIIVVDSLSSDETKQRACAFRAVRWFERKFDVLARQWNYALEETGIQTEWVLALDADYVLSDALVEELRTLEPPPDVCGYRAKFVYCIYGRPLRGNLYPPVTVLYRRERTRYRQDGHAHRVQVDGPIADLEATIDHDDRKSLTFWIQSQNRYMLLELEKLRSTPWKQLSWPDRIRKMRVVAPVLVLFHCLFVKGGLLDGKAGWFYAFQRMVAETILSLYLLNSDLE